MSNVKKIFTVQNLLWLSLTLALLGSLRHLAAMFQSVDGSYFFGYLSAIAVDCGLFSLSFSLRKRKAEKRGAKLLWVGLVLFTGISVYGNYAYGIMATGGTLPGWIVSTRPIVLAASLPILVLYLAELVSDNREHAAREAAKEERKAARKSGNTRVASDNLDKVNADKAAAKEQNLARLKELLTEKPEATNTELASVLDVSRATIRNYKQELNGAAK